MGWTKRFMGFHRLPLPQEMGDPEIAAFLTHLATHESVTAGTQNQARNAVVFFYTNVLKRTVGELGGFDRAKQPEPQFGQLSAENVGRLLDSLCGTPRLMASLICGSGMRIGEVVRLRIKDVDFDRGFIFIYASKEQKQRLAPLAPKTSAGLRAQILVAKRVQDQDRADGFRPDVPPIGSSGEAPGPSEEPSCEFLFPSPSLSVDPRSGHRQRSHLSESVLQRALRLAGVEAGIKEQVSSGALRHFFATYLLTVGADVWTVREILGSTDLKTTEFGGHGLNVGESASSLKDFLPTPKQCAHLAWLSRMVRSGVSLAEIKDKRWSRDEGAYSIYCLAEDGKRVRYIGITNQPPGARLRQHLADCGRGNNVYKENWLRSCANRGIPITIHVVRSGLPAERACMMEFELIRFFMKPLSLVNTHAGGSTGYAGLSEESKAKHRINTEKGLSASAQRQSEARDMERGYCVLEEWGWGDG